MKNRALIFRFCIIITAAIILILMLWKTRPASTPQMQRTPTAVPINSEGADWVQVLEHAPWRHRDSAGELVFNDYIWIMGGQGGLSGGPRLGDVWKSPDGGVTWQQATPAAPWGARNLLSAVVHNDRMWVVGGFASATETRGDVWSSVDGATWSLETKTPGWAPRGAATLLSYNGRMWLFGGFTIGTYQHHADVWSSADGVTWTQEIANAPWGRRMGHGSVVFNSKMWVIGGGIYDRNRPWNEGLNYADLWSSTDGKEWIAEATDVDWGRRRFACSLVHDNKIWHIGGNRGDIDRDGAVDPEDGDQNDVWYSTDGIFWKRFVTPTTWLVRHETSCVNFRGNLIIFGGYRNAEHIYDDVWALQSS